jgi:hypothetical protein
MPNGASFDFIFEKPEDIDRTGLLQGDLLRRSPELAAAIGEAHSYYADALGYSHFLVLTQSCDLVRRGGKCKSRYITICAVRPLALAVQRELDRYVEPVDGFPIAVGDLDSSILARQYLERVLNNTVEGIFFIPKGSAESVDEHLCAFLALSIALRVDHYEVCLSAKVAQTKEIFSAKIGSLASNLYSRIATPDLSEKNSPAQVAAYKAAFFEDLGYRSVAWLSKYQQQALRDRIAAALASNGGQPLPSGEAQEMLTKLPSEADAIADRVLEVFIKRKIVDDDPEKRRRMKNLLLNDGEFTRLSRR